MTEVILKIIDVFKNFFFRDLFYIGSGLILIIIILFSFNLVDINTIISSKDITQSSLFKLIAEFKIIFYAILLYLSYAIGYTLQEIFTLFKFVSTSFYKPSCLTRKICICFCPNSSWKKFFEKKLSNSFFFRIYDENFSKNESKRDRINRIIHLKQLGSAFGPSLFMSSIFLFIRFICDCDLAILPFSIIFFILSLLLFITNKIKNMQHYLTLYELRKEAKNNADNKK